MDGTKPVSDFSRLLGYRITLVALCWLSLLARSKGQDSDSYELPSLGVAQTIEQIVLPGSELTHRTVDPATTPLVVRVVDTFPHGNSFRYDISYFGLTKGEFDLRDFLVRKDGSSTDDLPPIPVIVGSILEEGQVEPNELEIGGLSRFGGYWRVVLYGLIGWVIVLGLLFFVGRKKKEVAAEKVEHKKSLADLLKPSVEQAISGTLPHEKHAELERFLFSYWQKRLHLENLEPAEALNQIRNHEESGPLVRQLEIWLHGASTSGEYVDVAELLLPYKDVKPEHADELGFASSNEADSDKGDSTE